MSVIDLSLGVAVETDDRDITHDVLMARVLELREDHISSYLPTWPQIISTMHSHFSLLRMCGVGDNTSFQVSSFASTYAPIVLSNALKKSLRKEELTRYPNSVRSMFPLMFFNQISRDLHLGKHLTSYAQNVVMHDAKRRRTSVDLLAVV